MKSHKAFTLLELLIASSIFIVLMVTIYSAFHSGIFGYRNIEENIDIYQAARLILERINLDLRNSFAYKVDDAKFTGSQSELSFFTLTDTFSQEGIVQEVASVTYKLEENKLMRLCRENQDALNDKSDAEPQEMASNLKEIVFNYGYLKAGSQEIEWKDTSDNQIILPYAVKVTLILRVKTEYTFERTIYLPLASII